MALFASIASALVAATLPAPAEDKVHWEKDIWPFIERSCVECHKAPYEEGGKMKEPKAELRFDGAWAILKGGENGPVLVPGDPGESDMYFRVTLPEDDDDFMPSKGEVLTDTEKALLKSWIEQGADFGGWEGSLEGKPEEKPAPSKLDREVKALPPSVYEILSKNVAAPGKDAIAAVTATGARVDPLSDAVTLYRVDYFNNRDATNDESLAALPQMKTNVAQLYLGESKVGDAGLEHVAGLPNLIRLDLHETAVSDAGIGRLTGLANLEYLNLYGTEIGDAGLKELAKLKKLRAIYLWKTEVSEKGVQQLHKALPEARINWR